jgi:hypothetical protein
MCLAHYPERSALSSPPRPGSLRTHYVGLIPSGARDVGLRAKADHQRIRNGVRGIGRSDHGDVNDNRLPAAKAVGRGVPRVDRPEGPSAKRAATLH